MFTIFRQLLIFIVLCGKPIFNPAQTAGSGPDKAYVAEFSVKDCFKSHSSSVSFSPDSLPSNFILRGQRIWRIISLENKQNELIFNTGGKCGAINLFEIIKYGLIERKLKAFATDQFSKNQIALMETQVLQIIRKKDTSVVTHFDANGVENKSVEITSRYLLGSDIRTYMLKEDWVFNSLKGKTEKFIVGLAPVVYDEKLGRAYPLFWLYYPEWNELFSAFEARNYYSYASISFHDLFVRRYFISQISKVSNVFDRKMGAVYHGYDAYLESERIKEKMGDAETDLFEY